jgi:hypothetical protein
VKIIQLYPRRLHSTAVIVLLISSLPILLGCKDSCLQSSWNSDAIHVDGNTQDWENIPRTIFDETNVSVGVCNDAHNLYFLMRVSDRTLKREIERRGVTVWFNADGKKKKIFGLSYRNGSDKDLQRERVPKDTIGDGNHGRPPMKGFPPAQNGLFVLKGSARDRIPISANDAGAPVANLLTEGTSSILELSVPLYTEESEFAIGAQPGSQVLLRMELGGSGQDKKPGRGGGGGGPGGERGADENGHGGDHGPGEMGGPGGDQQGNDMPQGGIPGGDGPGGGRGMSPQMRGGSNQKQAQLSDVSFKVQLAQPSNPNPK